MAANWDPLNRRKRQRSSDGSTATNSSKKSGSSAVTASTPTTISEDTPSPGKDTMETNTTLPLLEPPGDMERDFYYACFPSRPRLIGRTSSGTVPWWGLPFEDDSPSAAEQRWQDGTDISDQMAYGPVGPHPIHACWEENTLRRVQDALKGIDWTSIDVLRFGPATLPPFDRQIIVWVGIRPAPPAPAGDDKDETAPGDHDWALISATLRAVRQALDADGLTDVECEIRESEIVLLTGDAEATGSGSVDNTLEPPGYRSINPPRLRLPLEPNQRNLVPKIAASAHVISTAVGQSIGPPSRPDCSGTLGLYLGPADAGAGGEDGESPVWALTCYHVVKPLTPSPRNSPESQKPKPPFDMNDTIVLPAEVVLEKFIENFSKLYNYQAGLLAKETTPNHIPFRQSQMDLCNELNADLEAHAGCHKGGTVVGKIFLAPPLSHSYIGINTNLPKDEIRQPFTLDWALVRLWRSKFPVGFTFPNYVDIGGWPDLTEHITGYLKSVPGEEEKPNPNLPDNKLMRLRNEIVPLSEMWGGAKQSPDHNLVAEKRADGDEDDVTPVLIVLKRGRTTGLAPGVVLDIRSVSRKSATKGGEMTLRSEMAIVELKRQKVWKIDSDPPEQRFDRFSAGGDSGAAVFDLKGRVCGMITSGASNRIFKTVDVTYATPMAVLLPEIEKKVGMKLRIL